MHPLNCTPARAAAGKTHRYDRRSGWCIYGCGVRDDGRIVNHWGTIIADGPEYTPEEQSYLFTIAQDGRNP
jgi:hypothetical protein